jgi:hypothetical protein
MARNAKKRGFTNFFLLKEENEGNDREFYCAINVILSRRNAEDS